MMLTIAVEYFGQICALVQTRGETIELPDPADLGELLDAVARRHGLPPRPVAPGTATNALSASLLFVNSENVNHDFARRLQQGDVVTILSPIAGG